jgi:hypothetical protein
MAIRGFIGSVSRVCRGLAIAVAFGLVIPAVAGADVLVNAIEPASVACGKSVRPGIWYQSISGGPRRASMMIKNSRGEVVWHKTATATTTWRYWRFRGRCGANYVLTYKTAGGTAHFRFHIRRA